MNRISNSAFTLAFIKPETTGYPFICWSVIETILSSGLGVSTAKWHKMKRDEAEHFYAVHKGRFFYERLVRHVCSGSLFAMILVVNNNTASNSDVIEKWRLLMGSTKVFRTVIEQPTTLRGRFGLTDTRNVCHGSDCAENSVNESRFFFPEYDFKNVHRVMEKEALKCLVFDNFNFNL